MVRDITEGALDVLVELSMNMFSTNVPREKHEICYQEIRNVNGGQVFCLFVLFGLRVFLVRWFCGFLMCCVVHYCLID
jgi:hypothetical protein